MHKKIAGAVERSYKKFGLWAVAFAGFTPVPYKLFAICSGIFEIKFVPFALISLLARSARFFLVSALIFFVGTHIKDYIIDYFNIVSIAFLSIVVLLVIVFKFIKKKKQNSPQSAQ